MPEGGFAKRANLRAENTACTIIEKQEFSGEIVGLQLVFFLRMFGRFSFVYNRHNGFFIAPAGFYAQMFWSYFRMVNKPE
jgi:hypothetical protein